LILQTLLQEFPDQILRYSPTNGVIPFDYASFDPKDNRQGCFDCQYSGNHFTRGIQLSGFIRLLSIIGWNSYEIAQRAGHGLAWLNDPEKNGYDLTKIVIPAYMHKIHLPHLSLVEAIESGKVAELMCLKDTVGRADAFISHVQKLPLAAMIKSLEDAEAMYEQELLEDKAVSAQLRKEALETFFRQHKPKNVAKVDDILRQWVGEWAEFDADLEEKHGSNPGLANITAKKEGRPKYFIDFACIRQCLSGDFTLDRVVGAVEAIGVTIAELGTDLAGDTALLRRTFCVLESFATIKAKGKLLVCGPALQHSTKTLELAKIASDPARYREVMDCATSTCRWESEEKAIKEYIVASVRYNRTDKVVLAAVVQSCMRAAAPVFEQLTDCGASVLHAVGVMLFEVGDYDGALVPLGRAMAKQEAVYGEEAIEVIETGFMLGQCHSKMGLLSRHTSIKDDFVTGKCGRKCLNNKENVDLIQKREGYYERTLQKSKEYYERTLRVTEQHYGTDNAATARCLVGISKSCKWTKAMEYCRRAIALVKAAESPDDHADTHADALYEIGRAYYARAQVVLGGDLSGPSLHPILRLVFIFIFAVFFAYLIVTLGVAADQGPWFAAAYYFVIICCGLLIASFPLSVWRTQQAVDYFQQSLKLRESKHGTYHITTVDALRSLAKAYQELFQRAKATRLQLQVLDIEDRTQGPLSGEAGQTCDNIAMNRYHSGNFLQAAIYYKRAAEANAFTLGPEHVETESSRKRLNASVGIMIYLAHWWICGTMLAGALIGALAPWRGDQEDGYLADGRSVIMVSSPMEAAVGASVGALVGVMMVFRPCCLKRGKYLDEINQHDRWLEEDARHRGEDMQVWRRKIQRQRREAYSLASGWIFMGAAVPLVMYLIGGYLAGVLTECSHGCHISYIGDGQCDIICNSAACSFDGGDCPRVCSHVLVTTNVTDISWASGVWILDETRNCYGKPVYSKFTEYGLIHFGYIYGIGYAAQPEAELCTDYSYITSLDATAWDLSQTEGPWEYYNNSRWEYYNNSRLFATSCNQSRTD
jgi:tetratricopeptide (TPR) repeat protein